jgi:glucose/arabinose dehydrogenase
MKWSSILFLSMSATLSADELPVSVVYQKHCAQCHGDQLQGGNAKSLADGIWQFGDTPANIYDSIKSGITHLGMPAYENTLAETQLQELTAYILNTQNFSRIELSPIPDVLKTHDYDVRVEIWAEGLEVPWSLAFLDEHLALVTERSGRLRVIEKGRLHPKKVNHTPPVLAEGQGGLLAVAFDPQYRDENNQWIYLAYSHGLNVPPKGNRAPSMTRVVRGRIDGNAWIDEEVLFEAPHETYATTRVHFGTRLVFDEADNLYFSIGDRGTGAHAQDLSKPNGKIHRIRKDGSIPKDNPFRRKQGAMPTIFSFGHRNPQGISIHPTTGGLWAAEHGPLGGDELNLVQAGRNYGWPIITYGKNYNGSVITKHTHQLGMEQPALYWRPSTAVCGIDFYQGDLFQKWNDKLLVGALKFEDVRLLDIEGSRVMHEEVILKDEGRVRDVVCGPDGAIYVVLNDPGTILRLTPLPSN